MRELKLKLINIQKLNPTILIDGKAKKIKKNEFGSYEINHTTENNKVEIIIRRYLELSGALWLFWSILYFIVSLCGIFDSKLDFKCIVVDCKFIVNLNNNSTSINLILNEINEQGEAISFESETPIDILSNHYFVDKKIKKRTKIILALRIILSCILIATLAFFLIKKYL